VSRNKGEDMTRVYVSFSSQNRDVVQKLVADLQAANIDVTVFFALQPGVKWEDVVRPAIQSVDAMLFIASPAARRSDYALGEVAIAHHYGKPIYPIWVEGEDWIDSAPVQLLSTHYIDLHDSVYDEGLAAILAALRVQTDDFVINRLSQREFSNEFSAMFARLLDDRLGQPDDLMMLHLSETVPLHEAVELEEIFDEWFKTIIHQAPEVFTYIRENYPEFSFDAPLVQVREFTHPGSTEMYFAIATTTGIILAPWINDLLVNLLASIIWDGAKAGVGHILRRFGGKKSDDGADFEEFTDSESQTGTTPEAQETQSAMGETLQHIVEKQRYIGFRIGKHCLGIEMKSIDRTSTK
jgi:hypothetical protein